MIPMYIRHSIYTEVMLSTTFALNKISTEKATKGSHDATIV